LGDGTAIATGNVYREAVVTQAPASVTGTEMTRYQSLPKPVKIIFLLLTCLGIAAFIWYTFGWSVAGFVLEEVRYYYVLYATFAPCAFLLLPMRRRDRNRIPWYDLIMAAVVFGICTYYTVNAWFIFFKGWVPPPGTLQLVSATIIGGLALESARRMAGLPFLIISLVLGAYPLFAEHMPGILWGYSISFPQLIGSFAYGRQGMLGLPAQVTGEILIGFLIFAGVLMASGAGDFFLKLALGLLGRFRGGPAKVAVLASGFFGSLSGSTMANIVSTGAVTIPAMKRLGYPAHYAGAIEAVASNGGQIMPPVMGAIAFIMAVLTDIPYATIIVAAAIPAILYYYGLLVQVDAYAARVGLKGLPREEIPPLWKTLREGWQYLAVLAFLVFGLLYMRWGVIAPVYSSGLLLLLSYTRRETIMTPKKFIEIIATIGSLISYMMAVLIAVGFIMIGLQITGTLTALTAEIVAMGGSNVVVILLIAVVVCYLFGMIGMAFIPYLVLAVVAIPFLVATTGLNVLALHLFLVYYLLTGAITPPVCIAAFIAAAVAGAPPMKTGFTAMRLAVVLYFIPFFFVLHPALILEGPITETIYLFALCLVGIFILCEGLEGYLLKIGRLNLWSRPLLVAGGFLIAFPNWWATYIGLAITVLTIILILLIRKTGGEKVVATEASG